MRGGVLSIAGIRSNMMRTLKREVIRFSPMILAAVGFFCLYMANVPGSSRFWGLGAIWAIVATVPAMIFSLEVSHSRN